MNRADIRRKCQKDTDGKRTDAGKACRKDGAFPDSDPKIETGQSGSGLETLIRISFVLGVSLDVLMDMKEKDEQHRDWQEAAYLLVRDKTVGEVQFAIALVESIFRYKDEFLD